MSSQEKDILRSAAYVEERRNAELRSLQSQACDVMDDSGGQTSNKSLFLLGMHGIVQPQDTLNSNAFLSKNDTELLDSYKKIDDFVVRSTGLMIAAIRYPIGYPDRPFIAYMGLVESGNVIYKRYKRPTPLAGCGMLVVNEMIGFDQEGELNSSTANMQFKLLEIFRNSRNSVPKIKDFTAGINVGGSRIMMHRPGTIHAYDRFTKVFDTAKAQLKPKKINLTS